MGKVQPPVASLEHVKAHWGWLQDRHLTHFERERNTSLGLYDQKLALPRPLLTSGLLVVNRGDTVVHIRENLNGCPVVQLPNFRAIVVRQYPRMTGVLQDAGQANVIRMVKAALVEIIALDEVWRI